MTPWGAALVDMQRGSSTTTARQYSAKQLAAWAKQQADRTKTLMAMYEAMPVGVWLTVGEIGRRYGQGKSSRMTTYDRLRRLRDKGLIEMNGTQFDNKWRKL